MKILITGSTGFIGKHFIKKAREEKYSLCALVRPSTNIDFLKKENIRYYVFDDNMDKFIAFMQKEKFDGVLHLASLFVLQHKTEDIKELVNSNIYFGSMIIEACTKSDVKWFINIGTFSQHYKNKDYSPLNLYASTKQAFQDIIRYYAETSKINLVTIKLNDTFGPDDTRVKLLNIWNKVSKSGEVFDMSPGKQIVNMTYIGNVTDGFSKMIRLLSKDKERKLNGKSFIIKSKEEMSIKNLAKLFEKTTGRKLNIRWGVKGYRERENMKPWNKGKLIPGWAPKVTLQEGIRKTFK
jgi:CDP-paratose synthetase